MLSIETAGQNRCGNGFAPGGSFGWTNGGRSRYRNMIFLFCSVNYLSRFSHRDSIRAEIQGGVHNIHRTACQVKKPLILLENQRLSGIWLRGQDLNL